MSTIDERGLPANLDAERFVLATALHVDDAFPGIASVLTADDFSVEKHRRIFRAASAVYESGSHVNVGTVVARLQDLGHLESVDGISYLFAINDGLPAVFQVDDYLRIVKQKAVVRRAIVECHRTAETLTLSSADAIEEIERAERVLRDLAADTAGERRMRTPAEIIAGFDNGVNGFLQPHKIAAGVPMPWKSVASVIPGLRPSQLIILAARTSGGKTAAALQIAEHASEQGTPVALFSLEMAAEELMQRMVCSRASVDSRRFRTGSTNESERFYLQRAAGEICDLKLFIDDQSATTVPAIHAALRKLTARVPIGLLVVDYLQIMESVGRHENRAQEVSKLSRGLKLIAREFRIPVIALAQFNRAPGKEGRRPRLDDLKESGSIEQDADVVIFLHSEYNPSDTSEMLPVEFIIAKQRSGPTGKLDLLFHKRYVRFVEEEQADAR